MTPFGSDMRTASRPSAGTTSAPIPSRNHASPASVPSPRAWTTESSHTSAVQRWRRRQRATHEALALAAIAAIAVHAGALLFDSFLSPSLLDLTIPFVSSYNRLFTTLGIVCGWATALLGLSYYWRARIGVARWRRLHRWTALVWLLSIVHALGEGTDAGEAWFLLGLGALVIPALALLAVRMTEPKGVTT